MRLVCLAILLAAGAAHAGDICASDEHGNTDPEVNVKALEQVARNVKGATESMDYGAAIFCAQGATRFDKRIVAACTTILDREPKNDICMVLFASLKHATVGTHDVFAWLAAKPLRPWDTNSSLPDYPLYLFQRLGDPRGAKLIVDMWKASIPFADKLKHGDDRLAEWSGWRQHAAEALGAIGGESEQTFLDAQAKATVDTHVAQACRDAIAAIDKRFKGSHK